MHSVPTSEVQYRLLLSTYSEVANMMRKVALEPHAGQSLGATLSGRIMKAFLFSYFTQLGHSRASRRSSWSCPPP